MLYYTLQIIAFQMIFLLIYDLFLRRETFFNWNRAYLLGTAVLSFMLPFLKFDTFKTIAPKDFVIRLPQVIIGEITPSPLSSEISLQAGIVTQEATTPVWEIVFWIGLSAATLVFTFKILKLYWLKNHNPSRWRGSVLIVNLLNSSAAFSFFNNVFIGDRIPTKEQPTILKHELVHVEHKHTIDLLFFEILRIVMWFNPLVYMYQSRMKTLHEYIADAIAVKEHGKRDYYQSILNQVFETQNLSFTNSFFKSSLIQKRIAMLHKSKSNQRNLLKYTLLLPLVFGMLIYTSADVKAQEKKDKAELVTETLFIDQELTYEELVTQYLEELNARKLNGEEFATYYKKYLPPKHVFKRSLHEHARSHAFMRFMMENDDDQEVTEEIIEKQQSYSEYLEWIKTDKAKMVWELTSRDGVQHLFVEDIQNYTEEEQARYDKKMELLFNDDSWHTLITTDGEKTFSVTVNSEENEQQQEGVGSMEAVVVENINEAIEVPFSIIENPPTFIECKDVETAELKRECMSSGIAKYVNKNFNTDLAKELGLSGRQRISVFFKIGTNGKVNSISARASHPQLEEEAKQVIAGLPQFEPGKQRGKVVSVPYSLPILFQVQNDPSESEYLSKKEIDTLSKAQWNEKNPDPLVVPFAIVDKAPTFNECKDLSDRERKDCTSQTVAKFVNKNFNLNLASALGLGGRQRIAVNFQIGKDGTIKKVSAKANHPDLEEESRRVIMELPQMIPGEHKGKIVGISFSLPIIFQIAPDTEKKDKN